MLLLAAQELLNYYEEQLIESQSISWNKISEIPRINGVYMICHIGYPNILYIGESKDIWDRFYKHHRIGNCSSFISQLRKTLIPRKCNYQPQDVMIKQCLEECVIKYLELPYGRKEFEEYLINKYKPKFNKLGV